MDKWKIVLIIALIACLAGYGIYQQSSKLSADMPAVPANPNETPQSSEERQAKLQKLVGTQPRSWSIPAANWANTPQPITLDDLKGHITVIEFWRSGCPHCEEAVPFMNELYSRYKSRGVKMVTFQSPGLVDNPDNPENNWTEVQNWIKEHAITYPVAFDEGSKLRKSYGVDLYPMVFLLDRKGKIAYANTGHDLKKERLLMDALNKELKRK